MQTLHHSELGGLRAAPDEHVARFQVDVFISEMEPFSASFGDLNTDVDIHAEPLSYIPHD